jgi:AhpD family alkylhydroperoxidase
MKNKFDKRIYDIKALNEDIRKFIVHSDAFVETMSNPIISKTFSESISLAVTQVNGCKLCSYTHTKNALKAGMTQEEVESLLSGGFDNAPKEQLEALLFAQHYAETKGNPDPETKQKLLEIYGEEKTKDIISYILIIMFANLHGNTMEAFRRRFKGKRVEGSSLWQEIAVIIHFFKIMPIILFKKVRYKLFATKTARF